MSITANQNLIVIEGVATYERTLSLVRDAETDEGISHIKNFLKVYPEFALAHNDLAVLYHRSGNPLMALAHYEKAHKLDSANTTYRKNLADFYFVELDWADDAIQTYLDILHANPFDTEALNALGSISLSLGRREQARQYFSRSLQLDAANQDARQGLRQLEPAQPALSVPSTQPVPATKPALSAPGPLPLHDTLQPFISRPAEAAPVTVSFPNDRKAPEPELVKTYQELHREAIACANKGENLSAIQLLEKLVGQNPQYAAAYNDLGVLCQKEGELERSRRYHEEAVKLQPSSTVFQKNLADLLCVGFGELEEALKVYVRLQTRAPQDVEILKAIARICVEVGKGTDARFFLERVLALQPWDRDAQETLKVMESAVQGGEM